MDSNYIKILAIINILIIVIFSFFSFSLFLNLKEVEKKQLEQESQLANLKLVKSNQEITTGNISENQDKALFDTAINQNDKSSCSSIQDLSLKSNCFTFVEFNIVSLSAVNNIDISLCNSLTEQSLISSCKLYYNKYMEVLN